MRKNNFGSLSVKAGIDKNHNPTHADRIAGAKGMKKGGASMTLAKVRSAANKMGYKLTKK